MMYIFALFCFVKIYKINKSDEKKLVKMISKLVNFCAEILK